MSNTVFYTDTFYNTVDERINHLSQWNDKNTVIDQIQALIGKFEDNVTANPTMYAISPELLDIGHSGVRVFKHDGFKVFYKHDDGDNTIHALLLISDKQDLVKSLIEHCLIYR
ncbi:type II toxin-antitoxin system RelE/ParE family toxin [Photobacterium leiognathi]|uniref:type II toxin-antitoxin system RelE/ParE family toxin n=1 Tax=Photobacterium leiognathi TaxID=553611 RepID=UPI00298231DA|nr:type II toxin-antitoxin system RelE/ParE family toxin [Photobacterium leiognathi]